MIFLQFVNHMHDGEHRMAQNHPRTGIAHDLPYLFPHILFIAMNHAFPTNRFVSPEYTLIHPLLGVFQQSLAVVTQVSVREMMMMAVYQYHVADRNFLSFEAGFHDAMIQKVR